MTLVGSRVEWVLSLLACWRMGAVALPCNPQLRRKDLALRAAAANPKLAVGEARYLGELPDGIPYLDMDDLARVFDEDLPQETPAAVESLGAGDPAAIVFTSGTTGEARGVVYPQSYLGGQRLQARALVRRRGRGDRLVHRGAGLGEVDPQRLHRPLAGRRRRRPPRRPLRPGRAPPPLRRARRQRPLPGADRVPDARHPRRAGPGPLAAPPGLGRRADRARRDPPLPGAARPVDRRRLRPDRDRRGRRDAAWGRRSRSRRLDGPAAAGDRDPDRRRRARAEDRLLPHLLRPLPRRQPLRGRVVADRRPGPRGRRRIPLVRGSKRRPDPLLRLPDRPLRGRVCAGLPPRGGRGRGGRRA